MIRVGLSLGHTMPVRAGLFALGCRTHVSRAAKKVAETKAAPEPRGPAVTSMGKPSMGKPSMTKPSSTKSSSTKPSSLEPELETRSRPSEGLEPGAVPTQESRVSRLFPKFMRKYANRVSQAPFSHITSFLILHELSAIVPLFGIWGLFYYLDYSPAGIFPNWIVENGIGFIRRMAERNNWTVLMNPATGAQLLLQGASAYAIVKATMPLRLVFSVWAMPWFARWFIVPLNTRLAALFRRRKRS